MDPLQRFYTKLDQSTDCWLWTAGKTDRGYAQFWTGTKMQRAHIYSYEQHVGPVPDGLELHHTCRNRHCVNPSHLEPVTHQKNCQEDFTVTHCRRGHEYTTANTMWTKKGRDCRTCSNWRSRVYRLRKKQSV